MRLSLLATLFVIAILLVSWLAVGGVLYVQRSEALAAETRQNINLARVLEEQTLRVLSTTDQATLRLRNAMAAQPQAIPDLVHIASETGLAPQILVQLSLIDARGRFIASNLDPDGTRTNHVDLSTREHVRVHLWPRSLPAIDTPLSPDGLFIGKPVLGKVSKRWTIQISRKLVGSDGRLLGVVVASLDPGYFDDVYRRVATGPQGGVTLVGRDRTIRARVIGGRSAGTASTLGPTSPIVTAGYAAEGSAIAPSSVDGVKRIVAWRQVDKYPLYVLVFTGADEALASWRSERNVTLVLTALLGAAVVASAAGLVLGLRRLEATNAALRISEAQAQAANQAKSEFLAAISHELRTPLTSIRGFAELMEHRLEQPKFRELAGLIRKGAEHLNKLLNEILDLAKTEAGAMVLTLGPVEIRPLVSEAAEFFALAAETKGLALQVRVAEAVPARFNGDALRLRQIVNNLLSNAIKFTPAGRVELEVDAAGERIRIHVRDTGPGIAPAAQAKIFEKFRQGDARVSYEHGGTGLGLALSRGLAELMHGSLTVASAPGQGACFTLDVPAPAPAADA
ncbi:MAG: two-component sensor histidine kinase [Burkholderiales bacterium]|nr:two-component sensor histidine kinase [Burkholderiales bacterium]MDE1927678.1 two-component sensor histidine kinase [Burkholderiales bacterium]MDE2158387.1 two-component sensor histidine kinase [Burkholderiales bacterium]MDE2502920.1 two-component sensor histidine kinase [Burkholderiales bacterium]